MKILVALVCVCALLGVVHLAASIVIPFLLALALATAFQPIGSRIARRGWPPLVSAILSTLAVLVIVGGVGVVVYLAVSDLVASLPVYSIKLSGFQESFADWLDARSMASAAQSVRTFKVTSPMMSYAQSSLLGVGGYLQTLFFVLVITAFIQLEARHYRRKLIKAFEGPAPLRGIVAGLAEVQRYMLVKVILSAANGTFLGVWCWIWGVDSPLMWGVLAFALNFIPVIGSVIAAIPPIVLALLTDGIGHSIGVSVGYVLVNLVVDNVVEPKVMGKAVGLSPLIILLATLIWGFVLGPVGAILAVPLTMAIKIVFEHDPELSRIAFVMGEGSSLPAPEEEAKPEEPKPEPEPAKPPT
ncbi:MAG: AI-2E family transporter [Deltaproteobacteria bacterium]|nr:AI-2E family transporter [Deltaproteobacteria bacterium]